MSDLAEHNRQHFEYVHTYTSYCSPTCLTRFPPTNLKYSKVATTHQSDFGELIEAAIREFKARRGWITPALDNPPRSTAGKELRVLDYACGAGTVSKVGLLSNRQALSQGKMSRIESLIKRPKGSSPLRNANNRPRPLLGDDSRVQQGRLGDGIQYRENARLPV
jgi:hypothetical protein